MPNNNTWSAIGAAVAVVVVFVCTALLNFFNTGNPWPVSMDGWLHLILPAVVAGVLTVLTPHFSVTELRTGIRLIDTHKGDAPVVDKAVNPVAAQTISGHH